MAIVRTHSSSHATLHDTSCIALHDAPHADSNFDQAAGLRRLFAASRARFVPLVSNPHVAFGGVLIERFVAALGELSAHVLVVDAAEGSPEPLEIARVELAAAVEPLAPHASYLAARGLPRRHVDASGSCAAFLHALVEAAPQADVVLLHAGASDLARVFGHRAVRPVVLAADRPTAVTHAYAGIKWLAQRAGILTHDLLLAAAEHSPRAGRIVQQLASCADLYLGAAQRDFAIVDPAHADAAPSPALRRLARDALVTADPGVPEPLWHAATSAHTPAPAAPERAAAFN